MIKPRKNIERLDRFKDFGYDRSTFVRLDKNERTVPFTQEIYQGMLATLSNKFLPMYPDQRPLYEKLSKFFSIDKENLLLTSGSDSAIKSIYETYVENGDKVIYLWPTYAMIDVYADMFMAEKVKIEYSSQLELNFESLLKKIDGNAKVVFVANPNQPTGTLLDEKQVHDLIKKTEKTETLLVFDEAYQQFSGQESTIKYVEKFPHVIVVQTFSKAFGLASARLGYIITQKNNINCLYKVKSYSDINFFALKLGEYLLENYWIVQDYVQSVKESKELIETKLKIHGVETLKGYANFVHLKFPNGYNLELIAEIMKSKGYLIRSTGSGMPAVLESCLRVTVGPIEQMEAFLEEFLKVLSDQ